MISVLLGTTAPVEGLARAIQLSLTPVFLLAGLAGLLNVLSNRLNRIVDRARAIQEQARSAAREESLSERSDVQMHKRRMALVMAAIVSSTITILLVALVVAIVFISAVSSIDLTLVVVPLFVLAMACLMVTAILFLRETQLAAAQLRRRF